MHNPDVMMAMRLLFWVSAGMVFYVYAGYPALLFLISRFRRMAAVDPAFTPSISILIAAYNEEKSIRSKLEETLALDYPADRREILVLSDCSSDATDEIVGSFANRGVRLIRVPKRLGKTNAQNFGVREATGEVLVFSDATTKYHSQALRYLAANYADARVGAVSGRYQYFDETGNSPTGAGTVAFWNYENLIKALQSRISTLTGCCGCIYSVRRTLYTYLAPGIISDLVQPLWIVRQGFKVRFEPRALAYEATTTGNSEEYRMRVRVVTRAIHGIASVPGILNPVRHPWVAFQLWSHKVLRWAVGAFLLACLVSSAALASQGFFRILLLGELAFLLTALVAFTLPRSGFLKLFRIPLFFVLINSAALASIVEVLRGRRYETWETVRK